jgi:hypothetical protein
VQASAHLRLTSAAHVVRKRACSAQFVRGGDRDSDLSARTSSRIGTIHPGIRLAGPAWTGSLQEKDQLYRPRTPKGLGWMLTLANLTAVLLFGLTLPHTP